MGWAHHGRRAAKYFPVKLFGMREGYDMAVRFKSTKAVAVENAGLSTLGGTQEVTELPQTNGRSKGAESEQARGSGGSTSRAALVMRPFALNPRVFLFSHMNARQPAGFHPVPYMTEHKFHPFLPSKARLPRRKLQRPPHLTSRPQMTEPTQGAAAL